MEKQGMLLRNFLLLLSLSFIVFGVMREEHVEVVEKAIRICLECIGIG